MNKDWIGNKRSTFATLGASSHSAKERETHDYYATEPSAIDALFAVENFSKYIWECAAGEKHLSNRMLELGKIVISSDIVDRVGDGSVEIVDFLHVVDLPYLRGSSLRFLSSIGLPIISGDFDIITNPPYKYAQEFIEKSLNILQEGRKCAMFLKLTFCEGQKRREMFDKFPPKTIYVFSKRMKCAINGDFENTGSSAACYAWFVWEKGNYSETKLKWV